MNDIVIIENKIYEIRGQKVMLDFDLAEMYEVTTGNFNKAIKRNIERFPARFMFQLNKDEFNLIFQNGISSWGGTRKMPYAFTEQGVAMLSSILNSEVAIEINISIIRAFIAMRLLISNTPISHVDELKNELKELKEYIEDVFTDKNDINEDTRIQLELINQTLAELQVKNREFKERKRIGYKLPGYEEESKK